MSHQCRCTASMELVCWGCFPPRVFNLFGVFILMTEFQAVISFECQISQSTVVDAGLFHLFHASGYFNSSNSLFNYIAC